jgi:hypothetical protein
MALTTTTKQSAHLHTKHVYSDVRAVEGLGAGPIEERGGQRWNSEPLQDLERLRDVLLGLELVVVDVLHDALLVEHVGLPPRQRPEQVGRDPPLLAHLVPVVAQQRVRQPVLLRERLVRRRVVAADADHFRPGLLELLVRVTERARLRYAPTRFNFFFTTAIFTSLQSRSH